MNPEEREELQRRKDQELTRERIQTQTAPAFRCDPEEYPSKSVSPLLLQVLEYERWLDSIRELFPVAFPGLNLEDFNATAELVDMYERGFSPRRVVEYLQESRSGELRLVLENQKKEE